MKNILLSSAPKDDEKTTKEIGKWITALMNTSGGLVVLYCTKPDFDKQRDNWLMGLETVLTNNWIPESTFQTLIRFKYLETKDQFRIYIFVCKSQNLVTFSFNAFGRRATGKKPIMDEHRICKMLSESERTTCHVDTKPKSSFADLLHERGSFQFKDPIPAAWSESETMEFKHIYPKTGKGENQELTIFQSKILMRRLGEYMDYLCAFANTHGGSLVLGVEEGRKSPLVKGFEVQLNQLNQKEEETSVTEFLRMKMGHCIWHSDPSYEPCKGKDWDVFYHDVTAVTGQKRKLVEVCVAKHTGGMFLRTPVHYMVSDRNELEEIPAGATEEQRGMFQEWKRAFLGNCTTFDTDDSQHSLQEHIAKSHERSEVTVGNNGSNTQDVFAHTDDSPTSVTEAQLPATEQLATRVDETKLSKSFKESQSEHKTDINVPDLSLHECCTARMSKYLQKEKEGKAWYPPLDIARNNFGHVMMWDELMQFITAKEWNGIASVLHPESNTDEGCIGDKLPLEHYTFLCNVLIAGKSEPPRLLCCFSANSAEMLTKDKQDILLNYALGSGRKLKKEFLMIRNNVTNQCNLFHFDVEVIRVTTEGDITTVWDSRDGNNQPVSYPYTGTEAMYRIACNGLAARLLRTRAALKDRYGDVLIEHLTDMQAEVLLGLTERVLVVRGKSGTGKTVIALHLVQQAMAQGKTKNDVTYICSKVGLQAFVSSQVSCQVTVVKKTDSLETVQKDMLKEARLIIVDDVHAIELGEDWKTNPDDLYLMLFRQATKTGTTVAIFFDPEQDYLMHLPVDFDKELRHLAETAGGLQTQDVKILTLNERIRNGQEINRFMQANQNQAKVNGTIECLNEMPGDDVTYGYIGSSVDENAKILNAKLDVLARKYHTGAIAVLVDDSDLLREMKDNLTVRFHWTFQDNNTYPVDHVVMCSSEQFGGLEAEVVLFLLPRKVGTDEGRVWWKYVNTISSRAKDRLEFLLPWEPHDDDKEQEKLENFLELFKTVSLITYMEVFLTLPIY